MAAIPVTTAGYRTRPARLLQLQRNGSLPMACRSSLFRYFPPFNLGPGYYHPIRGSSHNLDPTFAFVTGVPNQVQMLLLQKYRVSETLKTGSDRFFRSDYLTGTVDAFLTSTAELQRDVQIARDVDVDSHTMHLGLTFSFPVEQMVLDKHEKFISGMYLGKITRDTLLALVDAAPRPIIFGSKAPEQALRPRRGGAQLRRDGSEKDHAAAALVEDPEKLVPATLQCLKREEVV
ncbi:hypothetical protein EDB83DRAFT_1850945 [Lactarius deliciosus]|nr:hypothetical protein EDB83DRAFT_1850945 [Lactarius deliciosus]